MAWKEITESSDKTRTFAADTDDDVTAIEAAYPKPPIGSIIIVANSGSPKVYFLFPGGFSTLN